MATVVSSFATQQVRIGKEASYGVAPATLPSKLNALRIVPHKMLDAEGFKPSGDTAISLVSINDNYTTIDVSGKLSFTDILFILGSMFGPPVTTTPGGATLARQHVFTWDGRTPIAPVSYTLQYGASNLARQIKGAVFNGLSFDVARDGQINMTSGGWGKQLETGITSGSTPPFTATPTDIPAIPVFTPYFSVYVDDAWADLGTTQYLTMYAFSTNFGDRTARARPINRAQSSDGIVEVEDQTHRVGFTLGVDATSDAYLTDADEGTMKFIRLEAIGPADSIEAGAEYTLIFDFCVIISSVDAFGSVQGGVHALPFTADIARDPVSGNAAEVTVINAMTAIP